MRSLAHIEKISALYPIPDRDKIELAQVLGWTVIVTKDFKVGDLVVYVEIDSVLPEKPEFEFLRPKKFRIRTMKMAGVLSQGIVFPLNILPRHGEYLVGQDVTNLVGVTKYEEYELEVEEPRKKNRFSSFLRRLPVVGKYFRKTKKQKRSWPEFVSMTDEPRIQNMPFLLSDRATKYSVREKLDGQSATYALERHNFLFWNWFEFYVCSRKLRKFDKNNTWWRVAEKYSIEKILKDIFKVSYANRTVVLQGEIIAPNVQKNHYKVKEPEFYLFNFIVDDNKLDPKDITCIDYNEYRIDFCPLVKMDYTLPEAMDELLSFADGESRLFSTPREGLVFRNYDKGISFKVVSNKYLLKHGG